jgi:hypothetical protein
VALELEGEGRRLQLSTLLPDVLDRL